MTSPDTEALVKRVDRWKLNGDKARISVPLGEVRDTLARIETLEAALREARRLVPETGNPIPLWALQIGEQIDAALNGGDGK